MNRSCNPDSATGRASCHPAEIRKVIYPTDEMESINMSLRKVTESRGSFLNDEALINAVLFNNAQHQQERDDANSELESSAEPVHHPVR